MSAWQVVGGTKGKEREGRKQASKGHSGILQLHSDSNAQDAKVICRLLPPQAEIWRLTNIAEGQIDAN